MRNERLRVYPTQGELQSTGSPPETMTIALGDIFPALADAVANQRAWIQDFKDEQIEISPDLYALILAYEHYQRSSA